MLQPGRRRDQRSGAGAKPEQPVYEEAGPARRWPPGSTALWRKFLLCRGGRRRFSSCVRLVRSPRVVALKPRLLCRLRRWQARGFPQLNVLVLHAAPEPLDEHLVHSAALPLHGDGDSRPVEFPRPFLAGELPAWVGFEYLRQIAGLPYHHRKGLHAQAHPLWTTATPAPSPDAACQYTGRLDKAPPSDVSDSGPPRSCPRGGSRGSNAAPPAVRIGCERSVPDDFFHQLGAFIFHRPIGISP